MSDGFHLGNDGLSKSNKLHYHYHYYHSYLYCCHHLNRNYNTTHQTD